MKFSATCRFAAFLTAALPMPSHGATAVAAGPTPFADAVAVWHMADLKDAAAPKTELLPRGDAQTGIELSGLERDASLARGGDGRVARLNGGYFDAGQGVDYKLNLKGNAFTLCARLRDPNGTWMAPLISKHGGRDALVYNLFSYDFGNGKVIGFELGTDGTKGVTQVSVPLAMIGDKAWHDIVCRYNGATLQLFVDGVWMDEGFPMGALRQGNREPCLIGAESGNRAVKSGWQGLVDHVAIWKRPLSDAEIETLSGGTQEVSAAKARYLGPLPSMQYFRPHSKGEQLSLATGPDGTHFTKTEPNPLFIADPKFTNGFRDPHVFRDPQTGLFHLIVSTMLAEGKRGCLAQYTSKDLKSWFEVAPFLIEGNEVPECPDYFQWNGRYYLFFSNGGVAHYRISKQPLGPWERPKVDVIDGTAARVMKTAAFTGNRRIGTAGLWPRGYAGWAIFRELVQNEDGTLGSQFVPEMIPGTGAAATLGFKALGEGVSGDGRLVRIRAPQDRSEAMLTGLPSNGRVQLQIDAKAASVGLRLRAEGEKGEGHEVRFAPAERTLGVAGGKSIAEVDGLDRVFSVDIILKDNILDLCIGGRRTLVNWVPMLRGDRMILFVEKGEATFAQITVRPLR